MCIELRVERDVRTRNGDPFVVSPSGIVTERSGGHRSDTLYRAEGADRDRSSGRLGVRKGHVVLGCMMLERRVAAAGCEICGDVLIDPDRFASGESISNALWQLDNPAALAEAA